MPESNIRGCCSWGQTDIMESLKQRWQADQSPYDQENNIGYRLCVRLENDSVDSSPVVHSGRKGRTGRS